MKIVDLFKKNKKLSTISEIFLEITIEGIILNFTVFCIFHLPFTWYSWLGWGFAPYILGEIIPRILVKYKKRIN